MNTFKRFFALVALSVLALAAALPPSAAAATQNYAAHVNAVPMTFHISGQYTASQTAVIRFAIPFKAKLVGVGAAARASGGTTPTLTVDVKAGGTTVLSAPFAVTAGAWSEGTISTSSFADEALVTVDLAITGTSPTWNDITVVLTFVRT